MNLPKTWADITVANYRELREAKAAEFSGLFGVMVEVLSILSGEEPDDITKRYRPKRIREMYESVAFIHNPPRIKPLQKIGDLTYKGVMSLTLGEYIDILSWNEDIEAEKFAALMYRKTRVDSWGHIEFEPRNYDFMERANYFDELPVNQVWGCVIDFRSFNEKVRDKFKDLFPKDDGEDDDDEEEDDKPKRRTIGDVKAKAKAEARKKHQWQKLVHDLCGKDITKRLEVLRTPVVYVFNIMGMEHDTKED